MTNPLFKPGDIVCVKIKIGCPLGMGLDITIKDRRYYQGSWQYRIESYDSHRKDGGWVDERYVYNV